MAALQSYDFVARLSEPSDLLPGTLISAAVYPYPEAVLTRIGLEEVGGRIRRLCSGLYHTRNHDLLDTLVRAALDFADDNSPVVAAIDASAIPEAEA